MRSEYKLDIWQGLKPGSPLLPYLLLRFKKKMFIVCIPLNVVLSTFYLLICLWLDYVFVIYINVYFSIFV